jgi:hypothetical protein
VALKRRGVRASVAGRWLPVLLFQTARPREELRRGRGDKAATLVAKENGCVFFSILGVCRPCVAMGKTNSFHKH